MVDRKDIYYWHFSSGSTLSSVGDDCSTSFDGSVLVVDGFKSDLELRKRHTTEQSSTLEEGSLAFHA